MWEKLLKKTVDVIKDVGGDILDDIEGSPREFKVYFEENVDLGVIKENLLNKQKKCQNEIDKINSRLNNKDFIARAPKHIVDQEKTNYNNLKNDIKKISLTVKSL